MIPEKEEKKGLTVWLYGEPIGIVHRVERRRLYNLAFRYLTETARPFSAAYPNPDENGEPARYTGDGLYEWFNNLLPESAFLREVFERNAGGRDVYGVIKGNSAAEYIGAIGFKEPQSVQEYRGLEDKSKRFRALADNWGRPINPLEGRRSIALAGATSKTGVTIDAKGNWYYPANDSSHSTHVLKINDTFLLDAGLEIVEVCSQETLRRLDIKAAQTELAVPYGELQAVLSKRFDRVLTETDSLQVAPIHQEDLMAATGGGPHEKQGEYGREMEWAKSFGYPKLAELLHHHSERPEKEKRALARLVAATYLVGDSDKHPKNIALLHSEANEPFRVTLAPAYDTISAYCLEDRNISQNQAIPIGHQYLRSRISARAIRQFAEDIGLDAGAVERVFQDVAEKMPDIFDEVATEKLKSEPVLDRDRAKTSLDMTRKGINRECKRLLRLYRQRKNGRNPWESNGCPWCAWTRRGNT